MGNNTSLAQQLPAAAFNPQPDPATVATNLVRVGIYIASSAVSSALRRPLPHPVIMRGSYVQYAFDIALAVIFLFGIGMILIGWLVADEPERYATLARTAMRASHIVLVFAVALHEFTSTSATEANASTK